ncbi:MAG: recombinase family protein, partial [Dysosmobacter sp.]|nr:recombinase family protein [Dysosmobacter sp.]
QKDKIRRRYQGTVSEKVRIIPVTAAQPDFDDDSTPKRVAVYARVSTGDPRQTSSYELQKNYYESQVQKHPNWTLVSIYADEGLSGTSIQKRKEFNR